MEGIRGAGLKEDQYIDININDFLEKTKQTDIDGLIMTMEASDVIPANHVITEFERGYYYKDRLLRAAKVIVSSGPK